MIFRKELKLQIGSFSGWALSLSLINILFFSMMPAFQREAAAVLKALESFPPELLKSVGLKTTEIFKAPGFFAYVYSFMELALAIYAMGTALQIVGREKIHQAEEFLLVKPRRRFRILMEKFLASFLLISLLHLSLFAVFWLQTGPGLISSEAATIYRIMAEGSLLSLFFLGLGGLVAVCLKRIHYPLSTACAFAGGFYLILLIGRLMEDDKVLKLTPFYYLSPQELLMKNTEQSVILGFILLSLILIGSAFAVFERKDIL